MMELKLLEKYREFLPITNLTPLISLAEGFTPLVNARNIGKMLEVELYLKYEGMEPNGIF